ncbi:carboxypeptidase regulatory-like domain-containing protein [Sporosarcina sp. SAFN-015]|uniref:carboxypeptidase regulatory-like domain-containing protein n=1 Tax=Sporosarcina sp. SAFN-015 TaxID=3387274 RepID=UPI003F7FE96E
MGKKIFIKLGAFFLFITLFLFLAPSFSQATANDWKEHPEQQNVSLNKQWTIKFRDNVDISSIKESSVYVEDKNGNKVQTEVYRVNNGDTLIVNAPKEGYAPSEKYTLYISEDVYSANQVMLKQKTKMDFYTSTSTENSDEFIIRQESNNDVVYTEGTVVIDTQALDSLVPTPYEENEFTFVNPSSNLLNIGVNQVIILPATVEYPNGWAKKVVNISRNNNQITISTVEPSIEEVLVDVDFSQTIDITQEDLVLDQSVHQNILGMSTTTDGREIYSLRNLQSNTIGTIEFGGGSNPYISFSDVEISMPDSDKTVIIGGKIQLTAPKIHYDTKWLSVNRLELTSGIATNLTAKFQTSSQDFIDKKIPLGPSIPVTAGGKIAGASVQFFLAVSASGEVYLEYEVSNSAHYNVGVKKTDGKWSAFNKSVLQASSNLSALTGSLEGSIGPGINLDAEVLQFTLGGIDVIAAYKIGLEGEVSATKFCYRISHDISLWGEARIGDEDDGLWNVNLPLLTKNLGLVSKCGLKDLLINSITVEAGQEKTLAVKGIDHGQRIKTIELPSDNITFESEDPSIADVTIFGKVIAKSTANGNDTTYIKVTYDNGEDEVITKRVKVVVTADEDGIPTALKGKVLESKTSTPLNNVKIIVTDENGNYVADTFTSAEGDYNLSLTPGQYKLAFVKDNFKRLVVNVEVHEGSDQQTISINTVYLTGSNELDVGTVSGVIIDSVDGSKIADADIFFREGSNDIVGEISFSTSTDANGEYFATLPAGTYTAQVFKEGYVSGQFTVVVVEREDKTNQNYTISKLLNASEIRVILTWDQYPRDLDLHLWGPGSNDETFHLYWNKINNDSFIRENGASLDRDDRSSYGPETITISEIKDGIYTFQIHDYSNMDYGNSKALSLSGAKVAVYFGDSTVPVREFSVPYDVQGTYWKVFNLIGLTGEIIPVNEITNSPGFLNEVKHDSLNEVEIGFSMHR